MNFLKHTAYFFATCILTPIFMVFTVIECLAEQAQDLVEHAQKILKKKLRNED